MKRIASVVIAIVLSFSSAGSAIAVDDEALVRILTRAYIADDLAEYCSQFEPSIVRSTSGAVGDMRALALHIRDEVIDGLPLEEANQIVIRSAQAAKAGTLFAVRRLYGQDQNEERVRLTKWCRETVERYVKNYASAHDQRHDQLNIAIENAKKPP